MSTEIVSEEAASSNISSPLDWLGRSVSPDLAGLDDMWWGPRLVAGWAIPY